MLLTGYVFDDPSTFSHGSDTPPAKYCASCSKSYSSEARLAEHIEAHHGTVPQVERKGPSPQFFPSIQDRQVQFGASNTEMLPSASNPQSSSKFSASTTTQASYTLNKSKQISNLAKHAVLPDFSIEKTGAHNYNVQCSTGFYDAVPKPALTTIKEGYSLLLEGTSIKCTESRMKKM